MLSELKKKRIALVKKEIRFGGAELLLARIADDLKYNVETYIICDFISDEMKQRFLEKKIHIIIIKKWINETNFREVIDDNHINLLVTFWIHDFLWVDMIFRNENVRVLHYVITSNDLCLNLKKANKTSRIYYKSIIKRMDKTKSIIFMDQESIDLTESYYGIKIKNKIIMLLPYECKQIEINSIIDKIGKISEFTILSIARADMLMKGYLIDLIKRFDCFLLSHENARLTIITFGPDINKIKEVYKKLPQKTREKVNIIGKCKYEMLQEYFKKTKVYVGMGTTILDAANNGVLPVPVAAYTNKFLATTSFCEIPQKISIKAEEGQDGFDLLDKIYRMRNQELIEKSYKANKMLNCYYSVNNISKYLIKYINAESKTIWWSKFDIAFERILLNHIDKGEKR